MSQAVVMKADDRMECMLRRSKQAARVQRCQYMLVKLQSTSKVDNKLLQPNTSWEAALALFVCH